MSQKELLALMLAGVTVLMFVTGLIIVFTAAT